MVNRLNEKNYECLDLGLRQKKLRSFSRGLLEERINIISTGGTAKILEKAGIALQG